MAIGKLIKQSDGYTAFIPDAFPAKHPGMARRFFIKNTSASSTNEVRQV